MNSLLSTAERQRVNALVSYFKDNEHTVVRFRDQLLGALEGSPELMPLVHSVRSRIKDPSHLRYKLQAKMAKAKEEGSSFDVTPDNLFTQINDLAGIRVLHLHTRQIGLIDRALKNVFHDERYDLIEGPFARTWDDESRALFRSLGIETQESPSMYTSVHYIVLSPSRTQVTGEIQVRTLMEEVWGEVDHTFNYPRKTENLSCKEQILVLARVTSSATRLVDSIFSTMEDYKGRKKATRRKRAKKK